MQYQLWGYGAAFAFTVYRKSSLKVWPRCQKLWGWVDLSPPLITSLIMGFEVIWMRGYRHPLSRSRVFSPPQWRKLWVKISSELQLGERRHKYKKRVQCELVCPCYLAHCSQSLSIFVIPIKLFYYFNPCSYKPLFTLTINHTYVWLNSAPTYNSTTTLSWLPTYLMPSPIYSAFANSCPLQTDTFLFPLIHSHNVILSSNKF